MHISESHRAEKRNGTRAPRKNTPSPSPAVSKVYSFTSGTIFSAGTCSPSMPGTQPVSMNISLASFRRAISSLVIIALLMIISAALATVGHVTVTQRRVERERGFFTCGYISETIDDPEAIYDPEIWDTPGFTRWSFRG